MTLSFRLDLFACLAHPSPFNKMYRNFGVCCKQAKQSHTFWNGQLNQYIFGVELNQTLDWGITKERVREASSDAMPKRTRNSNSHFSFYFPMGSERPSARICSSILVYELFSHFMAQSTVKSFNGNHSYDCSYNVAECQFDHFPRRFGIFQVSISFVHSLFFICWAALICLSTKMLLRENSLHYKKRRASEREKKQWKTVRKISLSKCTESLAFTGLFRRISHAIRHSVRCCCFFFFSSLSLGDILLFHACMRSKRKREMCMPSARLARLGSVRLRSSICKDLCK